MIQLSSFLVFMVIFFAVVGSLRGFRKEFVALAGIILALFTIVQFESFFQNLGGGSDEQIFYVEAIFLALVTFFAYQTPPESVMRNSRRRDELDNWQNRLLGAVFGGMNGYLVFGSLWYFMDQLAYPLSPNVTTPSPDSSSADMVGSLPLVWMQEGNLLTLLVIGLFLFILIAII
jgi:hypothetical protein